MKWLLWNCYNYALDCIWNVMAHAQKLDFVFRRNGRVHLNRRGRQFSQLLAAEVCASAVVMLDTPCSEVVWRVLATHTIRQFPLHFPTRASPCAIMFQLDSTSRTDRGSCVSIHGTSRLLSASAGPKCCPRHINVSMAVISSKQGTPKCAPRIQRNPGPVLMGSVDTFL